jgi:hypothetical protein
MALPEKEYVKLNELCKLWSCTQDDLIQFGAIGKLIIHSDFEGYVIVDGIYKDIWLPEKIKFGQTIGRLFTFDLSFNNPIAVYSLNQDNIYPYIFKVPRKEHVKVHLQRAFCDTEQPILLELNKHYDVNVIDNYISMLIPIHEFDKISISPNIQNWLDDINVQMSLGMEQLRKDDIKKLISKDRIQIEFLQPLKLGYFRCIAEGKNQELPWRITSELYVSRQSKIEFEKEYLTDKNEINSDLGVGSPKWRQDIARAAANTRHSKKGGSHDKQSQIKKIWASGKYTSRDRCAEEECGALGISFSAARKALRNTPCPT